MLGIRASRCEPVHGDTIQTTAPALGHAACLRLSSGPVSPDGWGPALWASLGASRTSAHPGSDHPQLRNPDSPHSQPGPGIPGVSQLESPGCRVACGEGPSCTWSWRDQESSEVRQYTSPGMLGGRGEENYRQHFQHQFPKCKVTCQLTGIKGWEMAGST